SHYVGDAFHRADALEFITEHGHEYDVIHASPPCQAYSRSATLPGVRPDHPRLVEPVQEQLKAWAAVTGKPWVIENVPGAPLPDALVLCGSEFGLRAPDMDGSPVALRRHRLFASNVVLMGAGGCYCAADGRRGRTRGVYGHGKNGSGSRGKTVGAIVARRLLGIDWMNRDELSQAIPPAYTEFIGAQLLEHLARAA
ncbi:MAG: hypothetical protein ACRD0W_20545, partial [Acidimicrobiales bacterium]